MTSKLFRLKALDIAKGVVIFVLSAAIVTLSSFVTQQNFNVFTADWTLIGSEIVNVSFISTIAYLIKNFFSSDTAKSETVLGVKIDK